jgi:Ca2+-binding RTX toxin-like protein
MSRFIETIEGRILFSTPHIALSGATLTVQGTDQADVILVGRGQTAGTVFVMVATPDGMTSKTLPASKLKQAVIEGKGGDDVIVIDEGFGAFVGAKIDGGLGNDVIMGGSGDDTINAGAGNDVVLGNGGNDRLIGEQGDDVLMGGDGNDRLDGGKGSNILFGDGGVDKIRSKSATDMISAASEDIVKTKKAGAIFI